jgi:hypothetical protein
MGLLSGYFFSPELQKDHPVTITPVLDIADGNPVEQSETPAFDPLVTNTSRGDSTRAGVPQWNEVEAYDVSWPESKDAVFYRVYGSVSPSRSNNLLQDNIQDTTYRFYPPFFSETVVYFFWVSAVSRSNAETYLSDYPASLQSSAEKASFYPNPNPLTQDYRFIPDPDGLNAEIQKDLAYIRSGNRGLLELNGEPAYLYLRRHGEDKPWGIPCSCTSSRQYGDSDPDFIGTDRCRNCFGTGIFGGFFPKIPIAIRHGDSTEQSIRRTRRGFELYHSFNTMMLWLPVVRVGDLIVRAVDGSRYTVERTEQDIGVRGIRLHQSFDLKQEEKMSTMMWVTDAAIEESLTLSGMPKYLKCGYKVFG